MNIILISAWYNAEHCKVFEKIWSKAKFGEQNFLQSIVEAGRTTSIMFSSGSGADHVILVLYIVSIMIILWSEYCM